MAKRSKKPVRRAPVAAVRSKRSGGRLYAGVDLGGTNINVGLLDASGRLLPGSQVNKKTQAIGGVAHVISRIADAVRDSCQQAGIRPRDLGGVGIGAAGAVDAQTGVVIRGQNLGFTRVPLGQRLRAALGVRIYVENDVNAAVYGEWRQGAIKDATDALGVWVGTGIGGGLILGGRLFVGGYKTAGEIGHVIAQPGAPFGRRTLEQNCSRTAVADRLMYLVATGHASVLEKSMAEERKKLAEKGEIDHTKMIRSRHIAAAYRAGDPITVRVVDESARLLGTEIAGVVSLLSLPSVVLGGGLTEALGEPYIRNVRKAVREEVFPADLKKVQVVGTTLRDTAGIIGAALLARENL